MGKADEDGDIDLNLDQIIMVQQITWVGTKAPCKDFDVLMSKKSSPDLFEKLSEKMWNIIDKLIEKSFGAHLDYKKALQSISHLKQKSIKEEEPLLFNNALIKFKAKYKEKKKKLWSMLREQKDITLISIEDFDANQVPEGLVTTKQESDAFLTQQIDEKPQIDNMQLDDSDDDFADLD